jgi:hypothetical protein
MELDLVDAMAEAIVRAQLGGMAVGEKSRADGFRAAEIGAVVAYRDLRPSRRLRASGLRQRAIGRVEVVAFERGRLVQHFVGVQR